LLNLRCRRLPRAIEWLRRAVRLEASNYWYQYLVAYLEDLSGNFDGALSNYSVAAALQPDSPWVRFSRARLYRSKGELDYALEDITSALERLKDGPEACKVKLELGYLYQELGDFKNARLAYDEVIHTDKTDAYAPAARLNRANIDAESGAFERARLEYDALLQRDFRDTSARHSRALLELRLGQAERARIDATALLDMQSNLKNRDEVLAARALALVLLGQPATACEDAALAQRLLPSPAHERLYQRAVLAAGKAHDLQLDRPEDIALLPIAGRRLERDLRAMLTQLDRAAAENPDERFRALLNQAVIRAALNEPKDALKAATKALELSPHAPRCFLVRARVRAYAHDRKGAHDDVERGLAIQANDPGLLEMRGILSVADGNTREALEDFDQALYHGASDRAHLHKARALAARGQVDEAVNEWSRALRRDPELPDAYLGRAHAQMLRSRIDLALADLEQAASWAHADPKIELAIAVTYFECLIYRLNRAPRWFALAERTLRDFGRALAARATSPGAAPGNDPNVRRPAPLSFAAPGARNHRPQDQP
jgi:eukaryotic-like serine/threonine-protein kinase